jgi:hypothetical protein
MKATKSDVRVVKTRDSATTILRKLGIKQRDYNFFVKKMDDGTFQCDAGAAKKHLEDLTATPTKKVVTGSFSDLLSLAGKESDKPKNKGGGRRYGDPSVKVEVVCKGIGEICKTMILAGKSNKEIWDHIRDRFQLQDNKKRGYAAWYRGYMKRTGELNG